MKLIFSILAVVVVLLGIALWMIPGEKPPPVISDPTPEGVNGLHSENSSPSNPGLGRSRAQKSVPLDNDSDLSKINPDYPTLEMRLSEMESRRKDQAFDPDAVLAVMQKNAAWDGGNVDVDKLELSEEELRDGREFINFDRLKLESLVSGDTMDLPINQIGQTYQTRINQAQSNPDGSVTWQGTLMEGDSPLDTGDGQSYEISITSGKHVVSGGIFTPEGHFVIEAVDDQGWIANASTLFKFDENKPDFIEPPADPPASTPDP